MAKLSYDNLSSTSTVSSNTSAVSGVTENPASAQISVSLGNYALSTLPPQTVVNLTNTRTYNDTANSASISLIDQSAYKIENLLMTTGSKITDKVIRYQYGYPTVPSRYSKIYKGLVLDYTPTITGTSIELSLSIGAAEAISTRDTTRQSYDTTTSKLLISDIVKSICNYEGWKIGKIEATKYISHTFTCITDSISFINKSLIPLSVSAVSGTGGYVFYFTHDDNGDPIANYHPAILKSNPTKSFSNVSSKTTNPLSLGTQGAEILSWSPKINGSLFLSGYLGTSTTNVLIDTGDEYKADAASALSALNSTENYTFIKGAGTADKSFIYPSSSLDGITTFNQTEWVNAANSVYQCSATLIGQPRLELFDTAEFTIYCNGKLHYTSGAYLITSLRDNVSAGNFTTDIALLKNSSHQGTSNTGSTPSAKQNYAEEVRKETTAKDEYLRRKREQLMEYYMSDK